jgi:hypothetical protein
MLKGGAAAIGIDLIRACPLAINHQLRHVSHLSIGVED